MRALKAVHRLETGDHIKLHAWRHGWYVHVADQHGRHEAVKARSAVEARDAMKWLEGTLGGFGSPHDVVRGVMTWAQSRETVPVEEPGT